MTIVGCGEKTARPAGDTSAAATPTTNTLATVKATAHSGRLEGDEDDDDTVAGTVPGGHPDSDADFDNDSKAAQHEGYHDADDRTLLSWAHPASPGDMRKIATLVKRYYAFAAAGDGARGCELIYTLFAEAIPEDYGQPPGPPELRGKTCAEVMTKLYRQQSGHLSEDVATLRVTSVRELRGQARAFVGFATTPAGYIDLRRERGRWTVDAPLVNALP